MNAVNTGRALNFAGLIILIAANYGVKLTLEQAIELNTLITTIGLAINHFLIEWINSRKKPAPAEARAGAESGFARPGMLGLTAGLTVALLAGCASFQNNIAAEHLIVQYATMKVIEADREHMPERAAKIREIAVPARNFFGSSPTPLAVLRGDIEARLLPISLSPADRVLADALINAVVAELQARVVKGLAPAEQLYQVDAVLGWVIDATEFYK